LCPPHTKRLLALPALLLFVLEVEVEKAHIAHLVEEIATDTAARKRKVHQGNIGRNSLVWVGVLLGSNLSFSVLVVGCAKFFFTYIFITL
jgi:hypothetical protein